MSPIHSPQTLAIARLLLEQRIVQFSRSGPVKFASGILSPVYCDNRLLLSNPEARRAVIDAFVAQAKTFADCAGVAGTATAGIPWAAWLAEALHLPLYYVRAAAKDHGKQRLVEGGSVAQKKILLLEDLITTGGSSQGAAAALIAEGAILIGILAIFSYGFQDRANPDYAPPYPVRSLTNLEALMETAAQGKFWTEQELAEVRAFAATPWKYGIKEGR